MIRTAQALGYPGLGELRRSLANRYTDVPLAERLRDTLADTPPDQVLARTISNHLAGLQVLADRVTPEMFDEAVGILGASTRVVWRGIGPSAALAQYGQLLCGRIGRPSSSMTQMGTSFADELLSLQPTDAVVVLAYGRLQAHVLVLLDHAASLGIRVILVTDQRPAKLADRVELVLESGRGIPGLFASHTATLVLIEALVLGLAASDQGAAEGSLAHLNDLRASLAGRRLDVDRP